MSRGFNNSGGGGWPQGHTEFFNPDRRTPEEKEEARKKLNARIEALAFEFPITPEEVRLARNRAARERRARRKLEQLQELKQLMIKAAQTADGSKDHQAAGSASR